MRPRKFREAGSLTLVVFFRFFIFASYPRPLGSPHSGVIFFPRMGRDRSVGFRGKGNGAWKGRPDVRLDIQDVWCSPAAEIAQVIGRGLPVAMSSWRAERR
jgi:hypothetical protein